MLAKVVFENLNVRSAPRAAPETVIGQLQRGQEVTVTGAAPGAPRWAMIEYRGGDEAYVARRGLAQAPDAAPLRLGAETERLVAGVILAATRRYDGIRYRLGCKAKAAGLDGLAFSGSDIAGKPCSGGTVDCSGWVAGLVQLLAANVNDAAGRRVLDTRAVNRLATHSDGQIVGVGAATGQVWSGTDIDGLALRSGLLFGLNNGDYDWEGEGRVLGIDHIVMGVAGAGGYQVTQSSSSGDGVNAVPWDAWRARNAALFDGSRVHCVDPLAMGAWERPRDLGDHDLGEPEDRELPVDPLRAPAG